MKVLRNILIGLVALLVLAIIVSFLLPAHPTVERSTTIDAPKELVFAQVNEFRNWTNWQPWQDMDSTMKITYAEQTAGEGAAYSWTSEISGGGSMEIVESKAGESLQTAIDFGIMGRGKGKWSFEGENGQTKVNWGMDPLPARGFPFNIMGRYFLALNDMDAMMGPDFEKGLANLKAYCEEKAAGQVEMIDLWGATYAAIRDEVSMSDMQAFFSKNYGKIIETLARKNLSPAGPPSGIYFTWDEENGSSDMAAAFPISPLKLGDPVKQVTLGPGKAEIYDGKLAYSHLGSYEALGPAHEAIAEWIQQEGKKQLAPVIEEYITDPMAEADTSKWLTRIIYSFE